MMVIPSLGLNAFRWKSFIFTECMALHLLLLSLKLRFQIICETKYILIEYYFHQEKKLNHFGLLILAFDCQQYANQYTAVFIGIVKSYHIIIIGF